jgi:adenylate cyclase
MGLCKTAFRHAAFSPALAPIIPPMAPLTIEVRERGTLVFEKTVTGPLEIGRQTADEPAPFAVTSQGPVQRLIVASLDVRSLPRKMIRVSCDGEQVSVENIHDRLILNVDGAALEPSAIHSSSTTVEIQLPDGRVICARPDAGGHRGQTGRRETGEYRLLETIPPLPLAEVLNSPGLAIDRLNADELDARSRKRVIELLRAALQVVEHSAGSSAFFESAARAAATSLDLDRVLVLLADDGEWRTAAEYAFGEFTPPSENWSDTLVDRVTNDGRTIIYEPETNLFDVKGPGSSLTKVQWAVASPILNERRTVVGVLYGERTSMRETRSLAITDAEATLLEVLASAVAGGLARQQESRARTQLEQFFSAQVTDQLRTDPHLLEGKDASVTVLFADVRGFSMVTERLGPGKTIEWINDVLTELSQCVLKYDGVLVDYVGDEIFAMWGAPGEQPDHSARAVAAAIAMSECTSSLRQRWSSVLPSDFGFGIGISSGNARVGNTGSRLKFKYGPLGNTVNVGSRVQGATKHFRVGALATESTVEAAKCQDHARRLGKVGLMGIEEPLVLYELVPVVTQLWAQLRDRYCSALDFFEKSEFGKAAAELGSLVAVYPNDGPTLLLLNRVVNQLVHSPTEFSSVLRLESK